MEHVGIVVDDLAAATELFVQLGLELQGEWSVEGRSVDRIVGLEGVRTDVAFMQTSDGHGRLELIKFYSPSNQGDDRHTPANTPGIRHIAFAVEDIDAVVAPLCKAIWRTWPVEPSYQPITSALFQAVFGAFRVRVFSDRFGAENVALGRDVPRVQRAWMSPLTLATIRWSNSAV